MHVCPGKPRPHMSPWGQSLRHQGCAHARPSWTTRAAPPGHGRLVPSSRCPGRRSEASRDSNYCPGQEHKCSLDVQEKQVAWTLAATRLSDNNRMLQPALTQRPCPSQDRLSGAGPVGLPSAGRVLGGCDGNVQPGGSGDIYNPATAASWVPSRSASCPAPQPMFTEMAGTGSPSHTCRLNPTAGADRAPGHGSDSLDPQQVSPGIWTWDHAKGRLKEEPCSQMWWLTCVISALRRPRISASSRPGEAPEWAQGQPDTHSKTLTQKIKKEKKKEPWKSREGLMLF